MKVHGDNIFTISTDSNFGKMSFLLNPFVLGAGVDLGVCGWGAYEAPDRTTNLVHHIVGDVEVFNDSGFTCAADTDFIQQVNDKSSSANNITQTTAGVKLDYSTSALNGHNIMSRNGGNEYMSLGSNIVLGTNWTVFTVVKKASTSTYCTMYGGTGNTVLGNNWNDGNTYFIDDAGTLRTISSGHLTSWSIVAIVSDGTNIDMRVNGSSVGTASSFSTITLDRLFNRGSNVSLTADYAEMIVYDTDLSGTEIGDEETRLNTRYSIY